MTLPIVIATATVVLMLGVDGWGYAQARLESAQLGFRTRMDHDPRAFRPGGRVGLSNASR